MLWSVQLEGDPWPHGLAGGTLYVWNERQATEGFRFPIQLSALSPLDGKTLWSTPIRPWLFDPEVPWSLSVALLEPVVGAWVKGDVVRLLRSIDGADAWSLPQSHGLASVPGGLVTVSERALVLLSPADGRTLRQNPLPTEPRLPLVAVGDRVVLALSGGRLRAVDPTTGKVHWERDAPGGAARELGALLPAKDRVLLAQRGIALGGPGATLTALSAETGAHLWEARVPVEERPGRASALASLQLAGDLVIWPDPRQACLRALELATGRERFRTCGLRLSSPVARFGAALYALGAEPASEAALGRGDPWYAVDFPLLKVDAVRGTVSRIVTTSSNRGRRRHRQGPARSRAVRATRLAYGAPNDGVLYLVQRNKFLTALRVGFPAEGPTSPPTGARPE